MDSLTLVSCELQALTNVKRKIASNRLEIKNDCFCNELKLKMLCKMPSKYCKIVIMLARC